MKNREDAREQWSKRMVDSVIAKNPLLSQKWEYECGLVLKGIRQVWLRTGEPRYYEYVRNNIDYFITDDGNIKTYNMDDFNIDNINNGKLLYPLFVKTGEEKYKKAIFRLNEQLEKQPRTKEGGFWHKKIYPYQMWLDGIYMAAPFIAEYAAAFQKQELFDEVANQIELIAIRTRDKNTGLYFHGYDESRKERWSNPETGCSPHFWGRSLGWFSMALVDVLDYFPIHHPRRKAIIDTLDNLIGALVKFQDDETGLWYQVLDKPGKAGNYLEASASCMIIYSIFKAARQGHVSRKYFDSVKKAYNGAIEKFIITETDGSISLDRICKVAGLGNVPYRDGSFEYYISEPVVKNDFKGTGAFILASVEAEEGT